MTYHHRSIDGRCLFLSGLRSTLGYTMIVFLYVGHLAKPVNRVDYCFTLSQLLCINLAMKISDRSCRAWTEPNPKSSATRETYGYYLLKLSTHLL
jgi:hypothetical protein